MKWVFKAAQRGDMVRVRLGSVYHFGIFVGEDEVIQFGRPPVNVAACKDGEQEVCATGVYEFLAGGFLEVAEAERKDKKKRRSADDTVAAARARLGERGYNVIYNNCEHFAYECAYGEKYCSQTEALRAAWRNFPVLDIYVAEIPAECAFEPVLPALRQEEIAGCKNLAVKRQKYAVWRLLEYGLKRSFGYDAARLSFIREAGGKWRCDGCEFSLSHSKNAVAAALSRKPVGVDIEAADAIKDERLVKKILTAKESAAYARLSAGREEFLLRRWTEKESLFKRAGGKSFRPSKTETEGQALKTEKVVIAGEEYYLTAASDDIARFRIFSGMKIT